MKNIKDYNLEELKKEFIDIGEKPFRAEQVFKWIYEAKVESFDDLSNYLYEKKAGDKVTLTVKRAIEEPLRQIVANAGVEGAVVVQKVKDGEGDFGYNARTGVYENMHAAGVIDPAKVTRVALENAASIAGMFLTTECVIADKKEENPAPMQAPGMGGMGGMM